MCNKKTWIIRWFGALLALLLLWPPLPAEQRRRRSDETQDLIFLNVAANRVSVQFNLPPRQTGRLEAELYEIGGRLLAQVARRYTGQPLQIDLFARINLHQLENYYLRYRFAENLPFKQYSLLFAGEILQITVLGQRDFIAGTAPVIRVLVQDQISQNPIWNAQVTAEVIHHDQTISQFTGITDQNGEVAVKLPLPEESRENARLKVHVTSQSNSQTIEDFINVRRVTKTLLTTDKPLYQPGQTIHIRTLSLSHPMMKPLTYEDITFEVQDPKGNKVFKQHKKTDNFGISHADFILADELNQGDYRICAYIAGAHQEKTVTVERYVLPKFKINIKTDRNFYQPGAAVNGEIQADYFFGKPVAKGQVEIRCSRFDLDYDEFQIIEGPTDQNGHYRFEIQLPENFAGQSLPAGEASAKFDIKITDDADHSESAAHNVTVTESPILIAAVPESAELIPQLTNKIYIVTTYADGAPAPCRLTWLNPPAQRLITVKTDSAGMGEIDLEPRTDENVTLSLIARDARGQTARTRVKLSCNSNMADESILVRPDKSLYRVGDQALISIFSTRKSGRVYIDLIKDRQSILTRTLELADGKAWDAISLDASSAGTVQVNAYLFGPDGITVFDQRLIIVDPADDLNISITPDRQTYPPGSDAQLTFKVTDKRGKGVASALGVMVVDEAVFALRQMPPGREKLYFYLEKEITRPRFEIRGYSLDQDIWPLPPPPEPIDSRRHAAARVLLASANQVNNYSLYIQTFQSDIDQKLAELQSKMDRLLMPRYLKIQNALGLYLRNPRTLINRFKEGISWENLIEAKYLTPDDTQDPWGQKLKMIINWTSPMQPLYGYVFSLGSAGIDGQWNTFDDIWIPNYSVMRGRMFPPPNMGGMMGMGGRGGIAGGAGSGRRILQPVTPPIIPSSSKPTIAEPVRIREYFPETLYFNPALITDGRGNAVLNVPLADSITSWRLTCLASSLNGQLGSAAADIAVFQDFFIDIDFPVSLTRNDRIHVPVAVYNYLKTDQTIQLQVEKDDWFQLMDLPQKTVTLAPSELRAVYFPIIAQKAGFQKFTVTARGSALSDAVARTVEIVPDGREYLITESGRLDGDATHIITIPHDAIDNADKIFVKIYPGLLSQLIENLDRMLRLPYGCFEQTSSVTYPNILVLDYLQTTGKVTPEIETKARSFINTGYQRLLSFEAPGGGFEWFGETPAHLILTAYGLMEFYDMSKVHHVDPDIITRTRQWLLKRQQNDGSFQPPVRVLSGGMIKELNDNILRHTAYITWALANTGHDGPEIKKGMDYLRSHLDDMKDVYTRVLVANAMAAVDPENETTLDTLRTLHDMRIEKDDIVFWQAKSATPTYGSGKAADIELTALAVQAFIRCNRQHAAVNKALNYLVQQKDAHGAWQSTQATIQALRALLMAQRRAAAQTDAALTLSINGETVKELTIDQTNCDVLQLIDLKDYTRKGKNTITLASQQTAALSYQIVGRYYLPYSALTPLPSEPFSLSVDFDRTQLAVDDIINVTAALANNRPDAAHMVILDLGLPPGFTLIPDKLNQLVQKGVIEKYSPAPRRITVYLRQVTRENPLRISYQLLAQYPLRAQTPKSAAYEYYNPQIKTETPPVMLEVIK